jgi:hypothetical protein
MAAPTNFFISPASNKTSRLTISNCYGISFYSIRLSIIGIRQSADGGWQTPDAPNNIIHVRLATGSLVEQMNTHPFVNLHTALTHNGETTNYEALKQQVQRLIEKSGNNVGKQCSLLVILFLPLLSVVSCVSK